MNMSSNAAMNPPIDNVAPSANCTMNQVKDKANEMKDKVTKEASEMTNNFGQKLSDATEALTTEIRKAPVQSAVIALTVGIVGTLLYKRAA